MKFDQCFVLSYESTWYVCACVHVCVYGVKPLVCFGHMSEHLQSALLDMSWTKTFLLGMPCALCLTLRQLRSNFCFSCTGGKSVPVIR